MIERLLALMYGFIAGASFVAAFVARNIAGDSDIFLLGLVAMVVSLAAGIWMPWLMSTGRSD